MRGRKPNKIDCKRGRVNWGPWALTSTHHRYYTQKCIHTYRSKWIFKRTFLSILFLSFLLSKSVKSISPLDCVPKNNDLSERKIMRVESCLYRSEFILFSGRKGKGQWLVLCPEPGPAAATQLEHLEPQSGAEEKPGNKLQQAFYSLGIVWSMLKKKSPTNRIV